EWTVGGAGAFNAISDGAGTGTAEFTDAKHKNDTALPGDWMVTWQITEDVTGNAGPANKQSAGAMSGVLHLTVRHVGGPEIYTYTSNCIHEAGIDTGGLEAEFGGTTNYPNSIASPAVAAVGSISVKPNPDGSLSVGVNINLGTPIKHEGPVELNVTVDATISGNLLVSDTTSVAGRVSLPTGCKVSGTVVNWNTKCV
ncbi:MAG: hypothetical protein M3N98_13270, partial [Actinomycetota bacterium]|nr:hypothetical protein [Actinomycetota bacterium]